MEQISFKGVIPPVSSIINAQGNIDKKGMANLIDFLCASDVNGLFFLGSAGEFAHMSDTQRREIAEFSVSYTRKRKTTLVGIGWPGTEQTIASGLHAKQIGAEAVVVVNPYYAKLSEENLFLHYKQIADRVDLPIIIYNFPALTGQDIPISVLTRLVKACPNIVGIKDTVDCISHLREVIQTIKPIKPTFSVFAGYDEYLLNTLMIGGDGAIPASANFAPQLTCGIYHSWLKQDYANAIKFNQRLSYIPNIYNLDLPFFNAVKEAEKMVGIDISTAVLAPTRILSEEKKYLLKNYLEKAGVLTVEREP